MSISRFTLFAWWGALTAAAILSPALPDRPAKGTVLQGENSIDYEEVGQPAEELRTIPMVLPDGNADPKK